jgi:hypothetical protein
VALTLGHTIHLHNARVEEFRAHRSWVLHELKHVEQFRRYGFWLFLMLYTAECVRKGYYNNRFEVEAREAEQPGGSIDAFSEPFLQCQSSRRRSQSTSP